MRTFQVSREIEAPQAKVFETVACIENYSQAIPGIIDVKFLSEQRQGLGTRFIETRRMGKREASVELVVTEYQPNDLVRIVSDTHGTVWDTTMEITPSDKGTKLTMTMEARAHKWTARLINRMIGGIVQKGLTQDLDEVKAFCEQGQ